MKKNIFMFGLIGLLSLGLGVTSCAPDYQTEFDKDILNVPYRSRATILLTQEGGQRDIKVETNLSLDRWSAVSNSAWCEVTKQEGKVVVKASKNENYKTRLAEVVISYGHQRYNVIVRQLGEESALDIIEEDGFTKDKRGITFKEIDAVTETVIVPLHTNLDVDNVIVPDTAKWITQVKDAPVGSADPSGDYKFGRKSIVLKIDKNTNLKERLCTVILQSSQNWNATAELVIKQGPRGFIVEPIEGKTEFDVEDVGEVIKVPFKRNGGKETVEYIIPSDVDWIKPAPGSRTMIDDFLSFVIEPNTVVQPREATFKIKSKNESEVSEFNVTVRQKAFVEVTPNSVSNLRGEPGGDPGSVVLSWNAPELINYSKIVITFDDLLKGGVRTVEVTDKSLSSKVITGLFRSKGEYTFKVKTVGPTGKASDEQVIKSSSSFWYKAVRKNKVALKSEMIIGNATHPTDGGREPALVDGNIGTYYHSQWQRGSNDGKRHRLEFTLTTPIKAFTFDYKSRGGKQSDGDVTKAAIEVSYDGNTWVKIGELSYTLPTATSADGIATGFVGVPTTPVTKIRFIPLGRRSKQTLGDNGDASNWFNMSEIELYEAYDEAWGLENLSEVIGN